MSSSKEGEKRTFFETVASICLEHRVLYQKKTNLRKMAHALWEMADHDYSEAMFMFFEVLSNINKEDERPTTPSFLSQMIRERHLGWNHPSFQNFRDLEAETNYFLTHPPEVEEGVIECRRCHSKKTFSFSKQTRRADESATVFVRCSQCSLTFRCS